MERQQTADTLKGQIARAPFGHDLAEWRPYRRWRDAETVFYVSGELCGRSASCLAHVYGRIDWYVRLCPWPVRFWRLGRSDDWRAHRPYRHWLCNADRMLCGRAS
jgi:hypothetical protein